MSFVNHHHQPDDGIRAFELMRDVYLQGAPVWPIPDWVRARVAAYESSDARRWSSNWRKFYAKTMKEARNKRAKILSSAEAPSLHLEPLIPILSDFVSEQLTLDLPESWDPVAKKEEIYRSLEYIQSGALSLREKQAVHLGCAIPIGREAAAKVMGITRDGVKTHISNAWSQMRSDGIDDTAVRWFFTGKVKKTTTRT